MSEEGNAPREETKEQPVPERMAVDPALEPEPEDEPTDKPDKQ